MIIWTHAHVPTQINSKQTCVFMQSLFVSPRCGIYRSLDSLKAVIRQDHALVIVDVFDLVHTFVSHLSLTITSLFFIYTVFTFFTLSYLFPPVLQFPVTPPHDYFLSLLFNTDLLLSCGTNWFSGFRLRGFSSLLLKLSSHSVALRYSTAWQTDNQEDQDGAFRNQWISTNAWNLLFKRPIISRTSFSNLLSWNFCSAFLTTQSSSKEKTSCILSSDFLPDSHFICVHQSHFLSLPFGFSKGILKYFCHSLSVLLIPVMSYIISQVLFYLFAFHSVVKRNIYLISFKINIVIYIFPHQ